MKIIDKILAAVGVICYIAALILTRMPLYSKFALLFLLFMGTLLLFYASMPFWENKYKKTNKTIKLIIHTTVIVFIVSFIIVESIILIGGMEEQGEAKYIIVLGAGLDGRKPSLILKMRLDKAAELLFEDESRTAILCGGQGDNEIMPEAEVMRDYLVSKGIAENRLYLDTVSRETSQNISEAKKIVNSIEGAENRTACFLVTNDFHIFRSKKLCEKYGFDPIAKPVNTPMVQLSAPTYFLREYFSLIKFALINIGIPVDVVGLGI